MTPETKTNAKFLLWDGIKFLILILLVLLRKVSFCFLGMCFGQTDVDYILGLYIMIFFKDSYRHWKDKGPISKIINRLNKDTK